MQTLTLNTLDFILNEINRLKQVVESIASQCDGAFTQDGVGFNKFDSNKMKTFLSSEVSDISYILDIYKSLGKYRKQMDRLGVYEDYQSIKIEDSAENNASLDQYRRENDEYKRQKMEAQLNEQKQQLLDLVEAQPSKLIVKLNKEVKSLTVTTEYKWIWNLYNSDRSWFKTAGLSLYKNDYEGGVWQIQKWSSVVPKNDNPPSIPTSKLVDPSDVQISDDLKSKLLVFQVDHVKYLLASLQNFNACLDASDTGCHIKGTEILMFDGSKKKVEDIEIGDLVMDWKGNAQTVTELKRGREQMFEIKPVKGDSFIVNKNHILTLINSQYADSYAQNYVIDIKVSDYLLASEEIRSNYVGFRIHLNSSRQVILEDRFQFSVLPLEEDNYYGFSLSGDGRFLLGDFTVTHNTGKTFSALACAVHLGKIPVILTPKSVIPSWVKACKHFGISEYLVYNYEAVKGGKHSFLTKKGDEYTWNLSDKYVIIFDEAHRCKNKTTLNAQMLYSSKEAKIPVIALSATIADNPSQMYAIGYVLGLFGNRAYTRWLKSLQMYYDPSTYSYQYTKESLLLLNKQVFPKRGHRISVKELGDLFPETRILPETFTVSETTQKRINQLYNIIDEAILSLREKEKNDSGHHLTEMLRARQEIELLKLPIFVELAQDSLEENNSVVIIVNFTETLNLLSQKLGTKCVVHGQQTAQEREKNIADFQSDKERIIIMNIRSGGVGVSLHDLNGNHPRVSLISPSWSAQDVVQAVGRVWRAGSKSSSIQKIVYCANTIEEDICDRMKSKIDNISTINEASVSDVFSTLEFQE